MQMLCRLLLSLSLALASAQAWGLPGGSAKEALMSQAQAWAGQSLSRPASDIQFAALDERLQIKACAQALVFDWPFNNRESLRVRCLADPAGAPQGAWQMYLRLVDGAQVRTASADPTSKAVVRKVVVTRRALPRGTLLQQDMVELADVTMTPQLSATLDSVQSVQWGELMRDVSAGVPLQSHDVRRAILVRQGQTAVMSLGQGQGFQIALRVEVMQDGRMGDQVRLKNTESGKVLTGIVTGQNAVRGL